MCNRITIYSVPGPSTSPGVLQELIGGGWSYTLENLEFLVDLNPLCQFEVVLGHVQEFGPIPELPSMPGVNIKVYQTTLELLSRDKQLQPAEQHGAILNHILKLHQLKTEYYLIIDPDCYLLMPNAFHELIEHIELNQIKMIGVSYPTTLPKVYYWDFPTAYFQFIDAKKCHPHGLDFMPAHTSLAAGTGISNSKSTSLAKILRAVTLLIGYFRVPVKKILLALQNSNLVSYQMLFYFAINYPYRNVSLFMDTGWKNRDNFLKLNTEVIPHRIKASRFKSSFVEDSYTAVNPDVALSSLNPTWHALMHGIYESRDFGKQKIVWRLLHRILKGNQASNSSHPATSIYMGESFLQSCELEPTMGNFAYAYEYYWKSQPFCVHLGHGGKENPEFDIPRLKQIRARLLLSSGGSE